MVVAHLERWAKLAMLCQKCGLAEATVHRQTMVYRQKIEEHLCPLCAGAVEEAKPDATIPILVPPVPENVSAGGRPVSDSRLRKLIMKRPVVVRDLATALGLKPFELISELTQLVGFAS